MIFRAYYSLTHFVVVMTERESESEPEFRGGVKRVGVKVRLRVRLAGIGLHGDRLQGGEDVARPPGRIADKVCA